MRNLRPRCVVVFVLGLALSLLSSASWEVSAQASKAEGKAKNAGKAKPPTPPRPSVQKKPPSNVKPLVRTALVSPKQLAKAKLTEPQHASDQQLVLAIYVLHSAKRTLDLADHDYGGHRGDAVKDIVKAEKQLHQALKYRGQKTPGAAPPEPPRIPEPQKLSDAQLRTQLPVLEQTIGVLERADHDYGGHRKQAVADLKAAVAQLKKALAYK
jgi:hypothetical protein